MKKLAGKIFAALIPGFCLSGCGVVSSPLLPGSEAAAAKNHIMWVRQNPTSLGYQRLITQARKYPDIKLFTDGRGVPDFLAETGRTDRNYLIFYYLGERQAYACRTRIDNPKAVEFAGPYPITKNEYKLLDDLRRNSLKARPQ